MDNKKILPIVLSLLALALPFVFANNRYESFIVSMIFINLIWANGMNLMYGYVGLMPLMLAGVGGVASYALVFFMRSYGWSFWIAMPTASVLAACVGVALGVPSLRLKGFYFTLCSLVIQSAMTLAFIFFPYYTNGDTGINQIQAPDWFGQNMTSHQQDILIAVAAIVSVWITYFLVTSKLGQRFIAIREDEILAEGLGIFVTREKLIAFFIVSLFASVGACLNAGYIGFISPRSFDVLVSLSIWLFVAFGGRGTIYGPIIGCFILAPIPYLLESLDAFKDILSGSLIILITLLMPAGIYGTYLLKHNKGRITERSTVGDQRV